MHATTCTHHRRAPMQPPIPAMLLLAVAVVLALGGRWPLRHATRAAGATRHDTTAPRRRRRTAAPGTTATGSEAPARGPDTTARGATTRRRAAASARRGVDLTGVCPATVIDPDRLEPRGRARLPVPDDRRRLHDRRQGKVDGDRSARSPAATTPASSPDPLRRPGHRLPDGDLADVHRRRHPARLRLHRRGDPELGASSRPWPSSRAWRRTRR